MKKKEKKRKRKRKQRDLCAKLDAQSGMYVWPITMEQIKRSHFIEIHMITFICLKREEITQNKILRTTSG